MRCPQFSRAKNGGDFEKRAAIGRRNTPHHNYIGVHARKLVVAFVPEPGRK